MLRAACCCNRRSATTQEDLQITQTPCSASSSKISTPDSCRNSTVTLYMTKRVGRKRGSKPPQYRQVGPALLAPLLGHTIPIVNTRVQIEEKPLNPTVPPRQQIRMDASKTVRVRRLTRDPRRHSARAAQSGRTHDMLSTCQSRAARAPLVASVHILFLP